MFIKTISHGVHCMKHRAFCVPLVCTSSVVIYVSFSSVESWSIAVGCRLMESQWTSCSGKTKSVLRIHVSQAITVHPSKSIIKVRETEYPTVYIYRLYYNPLLESCFSMSHEESRRAWYMSAHA